MFSNLEYLYQHLPARVRHEDLFLKRFLTFFGETLDGWDEVLDNFYKQIAPETATEEFIKWWMWALFGWSWYPKWYDFSLRDLGGQLIETEDGEVITTEAGESMIFETPAVTLSRGRQLYRDFTQHLARRGTKLGIERFLAAFSVFARVSNRPQYWGEFAWGEGGYSMTGPLLVVVEVSHLADEVNKDVRGMAWGELAWGEGDYYKTAEPTLTKREIENLLRFQWRDGQRMMVGYQVRRNVAGVEAWEDTIPWNEDVVPDETRGELAA